MRMRFHHVIGSRHEHPMNRQRPMNMVRATAMLGDLLARSISLAAGVSVVILLLAALFSSPDL
jgi:hypothetical protein